jgi:hypothetical protein
MHDLPLEETADGFAAGVQASDEVTAATHQCPVALRGVGTPLAVSEWRRLPTKVRQALPSAEDLSATVTRTVREIESAAPVALRAGSPFRSDVSNGLRLDAGVISRCGRHRSVTAT